MRISFDLDDTLIAGGEAFAVEYPMRQFLARFFSHEYLRSGSYKLIKNLQSQGWEIWVYTTSFRSRAYIKRIFWLYGIKLDGIVNQQVHLKVVSKNVSKYPPTFDIDLHVDDSKGVLMEGKQYGFYVIQVDMDDLNWDKKVMRECAGNMT